MTVVIGRKISAAVRKHTNTSVLQDWLCLLGDGVYLTGLHRSRLELCYVCR